MISAEGSIEANVDLLLVIPDSELEVTWDNTLFLVVASGVASKLKDLSSEIFENSSQVDCNLCQWQGINLINTSVPGAPAPTRCA